MIAIKTDDGAILTDVATIVAQMPLGKSTPPEPPRVVVIRTDGRPVIVCTASTLEEAQKKVDRMWNTIYAHATDPIVCIDMARM